MVRDATSLTLLERARDRDQAAWQRMVQLYRPLIQHWVVRAGVRVADAEDVVQEVFSTVAGRLKEFRRDRPGDTFRGWLRAIARFKVLEHFRMTGPAAAGGTDALERMAEIPDTSESDIEERAGLSHRALDLVRGEFEAKTWDAFHRVAVEGRPTDVVANELGMTSPAVRMAKSRVLRRLREEIGDLID
jgi:RNA polymerase sigma-70 factor (ECF subfamily)